MEMHKRSTKILPDTLRKGLRFQIQDTSLLNINIHEHIIGFNGYGWLNVYFVPDFEHELLTGIRDTYKIWNKIMKHIKLFR